jgi:hypothetical protein
MTRGRLSDFTEVDVHATSCDPRAAITRTATRALRLQARKRCRSAYLFRHRVFSGSSRDLCHACPEFVPGVPCETPSTHEIALPATARALQSFLESHRAEKRDHRDQSLNQQRFIFERSGS